MQLTGMCGKVLWVDLSEGSAKALEPGGKFYRTYLGGYGLGLYYLLRFLPAKCDPLSSDNILVFSAGLLAGTGSPCTPRYVVCSKSPLTGGLAKSEAGGFWAPELKRCGFDAIVVAGRAKHPVYLWVSDDKVEIRDASKIWGATTGETEDFIREDVGEERARIVAIGPGGENLVRFAGIANDLSHFNGRNGTGAVMGSKNLKAIAVRGSRTVDVHDRQKIGELAQAIGKSWREHPLSWALHDRGTPLGMESNNAAGWLPTRNWSTGVFEEVKQIGSDALTSEFLVERGGCHACPIRCKRVVELQEDGLHVERRYGGPEYETLASLGSNCGISNLKLILKANELCNKYTIDTISTGMVISFAMACYEKGLISKEDTGGMELKFGNEEVLLPLIEQIAHRQGFGKFLADGADAFATRVGKGSEELLLTVKHQEIPMHDPRVKTGLGLQFALAPNGADHWFAQHDPFFVAEDSLGLHAIAPLGIIEPVPALDLGPKKVRLVLYTSFLNALYDCLGVCIFGYAARSVTPINYLVDLVKAATGWETSLWELVKAGERVNTMARLFNLTHGISHADDRLPSLFFRPFVGGPLDGKNALDKDTFQTAVRMYYAMAGWTPDTGVPNKWKLLELGLDEFCMFEEVGS
ncbi:MAG: aldehyde ferredoxin oxidoreductase family protein [Bacillota bacterium]